MRHLHLHAAKLGELYFLVTKNVESLFRLEWCSFFLMVLWAPQRYQNLINLYLLEYILSSSTPQPENMCVTWKNELLEKTSAEKYWKCMGQLGRSESVDNTSSHSPPESQTLMCAATERIRVECTLILSRVRCEDSSPHRTVLHETPPLACSVT